MSLRRQKNFSRSIKCFLLHPTSKKSSEAPSLASRSKSGLVPPSSFIIHFTKLKTRIPPNRNLEKEANKHLFPSFCWLLSQQPSPTRDKIPLETFGFKTEPVPLLMPDQMVQDQNPGTGAGPRGAGLLSGSRGI